MSAVSRKSCKPHDVPKCSVETSEGLRNTRLFLACERCHSHRLRVLYREVNTAHRDGGSPAGVSKCIR